MTFVGATFIVAGVLLITEIAVGGKTFQQVGAAVVGLFNKKPAATTTTKTAAKA